VFEGIMLDENAPAGELFNSKSMNNAQIVTTIESLDNTLPMKNYPFVIID